MATKFDNVKKLNGNAIADVQNKDKNRASVTTLRQIPDDKLMDYPKNNEDVSYTEDIELSIKEMGFTDPIEVTQFGQPEGFYMILSGHRRRMAGRRAGMKEFPCLVKNHFTTEHDVRNYVLMANSHRDSGKSDPLLLVNRAQGHAAYLAESGFTGNINAEIARRMGISKSQAERYLALGRVIPQVQDLVRQELVSPSAVVTMATRHEGTQEIIYRVMCEAMEAGVELTRETAKKIIAGVDAGKRTWVAISAEPEQTKDSGLPLNGFINTDSGETKEEEAGNRNDEINREFDPIAAEYDSIEKDREKWEEQQGENEVDAPCGEETPEKEEKPPLSEHEQELKNGESIMNAVKKLNGTLDKFYRFASVEDAEKAVDVLTSTVSNLMEEICRISNNYGLGNAGKEALEKCADDSVFYMDRVK